MLGNLIVAAALSLSTSSVPHAGMADCAGQTRIELVCGIPVPEDLVAIPDTPWVIVSSMPRDGSAGGLYLIDNKSHDVQRIGFKIARGRFASSEKEAEAVGRCTPPDFAKLTTHGLSLSRGKAMLHRLYVVGHGGREAIELFNVDASGAVPTVIWTGCVPMPEGLETNSVVGLPGGGLMFTSLFDQGEIDWQARIAKLATGQSAGGVFEWQAGKAIAKLPTPPMSGPNGIEVSRTGKEIFLAGWGDHMVRRIDRQGRETASPIKLEFLPDNLHWAPDGSLLASGQRTTVKDLFACTSRKDGPPYCAQSWSVARIEPRDLSFRANWHGETGDRFGDSTSAIMVDGELWIGSISGECIAIIDPPADDDTEGEEGW